MYRHIFISCLIFVLLVSCQNEPPPAPPATLTATTIPTAAASATETAVPSTPTPMPPTETPTAVPTPLPLTGVILNQREDEVAPHEPLVIEFNQPMDTGSSPAPLLFQPSVDGEFAWNDAGTMLTFTPHNQFLAGRSYKISQSAALTTEAGIKPEEPLVWLIHTLVGPAADWSLSPERGRIQADEWQLSFPIRFNQEMDWQSVVAAFTVKPAVPLTLSWLENGRIRQAHIPTDASESVTEASAPQPAERELWVQASLPLDFNQIYRFTLEKTAVNTEQIPLAITTSEAVKPNPLRVSQTVVDGSPRIRFNYRLNLDHLASAIETTPPLAAEWQADWEDAGTVLSLPANTLLPHNANTTVLFQSPLLHADGTLLNKPGPVTFAAQPVITAVHPQGDSWHNPSPETNLEITFARPMDQGSVLAAFHLEPETAGELYWADSSQLVFAPEHGFLQGYTAYNISIDTSAKDVEGHPVFAEPYQWRFTTGELHTDADFGVGHKVQVVDAAGRRAVQYRSFRTEPISVTFGLYDLNQEQALQTVRGQWADSQNLPQVITWTAVTNPQEFDDYRYVNPQEVMIPPEAPPGPYLMTIDAGLYHDELLLFLSHNTVAAKQAGAQITVWTTNINGEAVGNLDVILVDEDGAEVANGRSQESGVFQTELPPGAAPAYVLVRDGGDLVVSGFDNTWSAQRYGSYAAPPAAIIHIHTDRPIYRPGHTVYFKALLRQNDDAQMEPLPEKTAVTAHIRDARGNLVQTFNLETNHFGSVHGQFELADGAMLGSYKVEITIPGYTESQIFKVEDYRKPDYEVIVTTDAEKYLVGDTISVTVDSAYFFGEPVIDADVQIYLFGGSWDGWSTYDEPINGRTDENGRFHATFTPRSGSYAIEATVDDGNHQSVSGFKRVQVFHEAETIALDAGSYRKEPDSPVTTKVIVADIFGEPVADRWVYLDIQHYDPDTWDWTKLETLRGQTGENGRYTFTFTPAEVGYYTVKARITDRLGNQLEASRWFMVYSAAHRYSRWFTGSDDLKISGSQDSYLPGENAQLFIQSTIDGPALLTLERADVRWQQLVDLTPPLTVVEVPITEADAPNIFASVMAWKAQDTAVLGENSLSDSGLLISSVELPVSLAHKTLNVEILPNQEQYQPGQEAEITLRVTNQQGDPVSAELSLAVVDEAIFSLSPDLSKGLLATFYFKRAHQIANFNAMQPQRRLWYFVEDGGGGGGGGGGDDPVGSKPRRDFKDTAAWYPVLQTDANGEVTVSFTLPDNLTSWRLTARAATADTQVGESIHNVTTWKPFIVRPALPRLLTAGDELLLSALIHNNTDDAQPATVTLMIDDSRLTIGDSAEQSVTIPGNNVSVVGWPITAVAAGTITLTIQAENEGVVLDAIELPLEIQPLAVPDVKTIQGQLTDQFTAEIDWPETALPMSTLQIDLNRSIAGSMVQGLEYLTGYPYGCVEQTMSRALPNTVVARAFSQLGVSDPGMLANLGPLVNASVQRLYGFQHSDGGWGWWTNDATHDYQTAWVVFGLATTADSGYEVDPAVISRGAGWLNAHLDEMDVRTRAFALYSLVLAGQGNLPITLAAAAQSRGLDTFSRAALALALAEMGETAVARQLVDDLADSAVTANGMVHWPGETADGYYRQKTMASATRNTALALGAFVRIAPGHELEPGIVRYLMNQRQTNGWGSTNETAFTILALTDHLLALQEAAGQQNTDYSVSLNGQVVMTGTLAPDALSARLVLPADQLQDGENELLIEHEGKLFYQVSSRVYLAQEEIERAGDVEVTRVYRDAETGELITTVAPNQLIQVNLTVTMPTSASYVVVEDSLPGGLEALNENLDTTSLIAAEDDRPYWQQLGYNHKEIRGNRVSFFITDLDAGQSTFTYYARVTHEGAFVAMPAEVHAMYDAGVWGRSASRPFSVTAPTE